MRYRFSKKDYLAHKEAARRVVLSIIKDFNQLYRFKINRVAIRNQKTRWGSCSSKGNLNFNYRIVFLTPRLQEYIVVHELCHLKYLNHSHAFWDHVAQTVPEWKGLKKALGKYRLRI
jgi:predicted metal-dependent hydrolase